MSGWYKRDPRAALRGMRALSLEEKGAYNTVLDLIYDTDNELENDDRFVAGWCGCDIRVWRRIKKRLITLEKIYVDDGYIRNEVSDEVVANRVGKSISSSNAALVKHGKLKPEDKKNKDLADANAYASAHAKPLPYRDKNKKDSGLGLEHRSLSPREPGPDPGEPDPEKFVMIEDWTLTSEFERSLLGRFLEPLGHQGFWRQVERFIGQHVERGTVDDQTGFHRQLEGWLERANANRQGEPPPATNGQKNGNVTAVSGADPPSSSDVDDFVKKAVWLAERRISAESAARRMNAVELAELKAVARKVYAGKDLQFGLSRIGFFSAADLRNRVAGLGPPQASSAKAAVG